MSKKIYTTGERYEINRVLDKVYEALEATNNDLSIEVGFLGVRLEAYAGPLTSATQGFAINDHVVPSKAFSEYDADRMIAELDVLEHFNKMETDTTEDQ